MLGSEASATFLHKTGNWLTVKETRLRNSTELKESMEAACEKTKRAASPFRPKVKY